MRRPGPLQELPLEQFLPSNPNLPKSPFKSGNKRPFSPGVSLLFSPAKRRILDAEGIFSESSRTPSRSPVRFGDILKGSDNLDFGLPKNDSQTTVGSSNTAVNSASSSQGNALDNAPTRAAKSSTITLAPSPELATKGVSVPIASSSAILLDHLDMDDCFVTKHHPSSPCYTTIPTMIPREMPAPPDRQSIHYPGFDILADTYIQLPRAGSELVSSADSGSESKRDKEGTKENIPPRRKARKAATAPSPLELTKMGLLSPAGKTKLDRLGKPTSGTSDPSYAKAHLSPTPRRYTNPSMYDLGTPSRSMSTPKERLLRKRLMEDEANETGGDDVFS